MLFALLLLDCACLQYPTNHTKISAIILLQRVAIFHIELLQELFNSYFILGYCGKEITLTLTLTLTLSMTENDGTLTRLLDKNFFCEFWETDKKRFMTQWGAAH